MSQKIRIHPRINKRHPDVSEEDIANAWATRARCQMRTGNWPPQYLAIGFDTKGRALQMVAVYDVMKDEVLIFHAMEATQSVKRELGFH